MTKKEVNELSGMTPEERQKWLDNLPWDAPCMAFLPGRYYQSTYFIQIPPCAVLPFGGDVTSLLWRYDKTPGEWVFTGRVRYYCDGSGDPDAPDEKQWLRGKYSFPDDQAHIQGRLFQELLAGKWGQLLRLETPPKVEELRIEGDCGKYFDMIAANKLPEWMHVRIQPADPSRTFTE